ncbi:MAG: MarR family transcriptional regulator [Methanothrix sp.]|jgi:DNA-binding transcriptional regulator GbsR (MarR family)|nr:MarR family transcriptional regulator [Methanothrix sp.]MDD4580058.1 MarR family transcriptional regulator [Methanothrix sp.]
MNPDEKDILKRYLVDACIKVANSYGLCDAVGVLRGTLFLAVGPISMDELVEETGYSKSTVSANMSTLERHGLAKRVIIPGDKRYYYIPVTEPDLLKKQMIANARQEMQIIIAAMNRTDEDLKACVHKSQAALDRIEKARRFYQQMDLLLDLISRYNTEELIALLDHR